MLKKFFISMLGTVAGIWLSVFIGLLLVAALAASIFASSASKVKIADESVLYIELDGSMTERMQPGSLLQVIEESEMSGPVLSDIVASIDLAADDDRISGIYLSSSAPLSGGTASLEEILEALRRFKSTGKWVYTYADTYSQSAYLLASAADSVFVNPVGAVDVHGVASETPFFTGLLDKLGVKMQIVRVGTYKSAVEPFSATAMSPASREQTQQMVDSVWTFAKSAIAKGRKTSTAAVESWADSMMTYWSAPRLLEARAVSALRYRRAVEDMLRAKLDIDPDDELPLITSSDYLSTHPSRLKEHDRHIAVLYAVGDIVDAGQGGIAGDRYVDEILDLADDDDVAALVLRINSGGGSAYASEQIWEALEHFKSTGKPFYVSMGDMAASGGYYIACGADEIYADRTTITGSIGVFGMIPDLSGLVTGKLGIHFETVESNPNAVTVNTVQGPLTDAQRRGLQSSVNDIYELFTSRVAAGRGIPQDSVKAIAEGRVWVGSKAREIGLVDHIGSLHTAIADLAGELHLDPSATVDYPKVEDEALVALIRQLRGTVAADAFTVDAATRRMGRLVERIRTAARVQARIYPLSIHL